MPKHKMPTLVITIVILMFNNCLAFTVSSKYVMANYDSIYILLNGKEAAVLRGASPFIKIGSIVGKCLQPIGFRQWICELPPANSYGRQEISLMLSPIGPAIGTAYVNILEQNSVILALSTPNLLKYQPGDHYTSNSKELQSSLLIPQSNEIPKSFYDSITGYQNPIASETYIPVAAAMQAKYKAYPDEPNNLPKIPLACKSAMTYIDVSADLLNMLSKASYFDSGFAVVPTKEPTVGEPSVYETYDSRVIPIKDGIDLNIRILDSLKINDISAVKKYLEIHKNEEGFKKRSANFKGVDIYLLDTYDSNTDKDTFNIKGIQGHGEIAANIIRLISPISKVNGINVCRASNGSCDERYIIDAICQAAFDSHKHNIYSQNYRRILVNMSFSSYFSSEMLHEVIRFARKNGVIFIVANGNADVCSMFSEGATCNQYPADWSKDDTDITSGEMISVGALALNMLPSGEYRELAAFDRGKKFVSQQLADVYAPGEFYQVLNDKTVISRFGTSFAAPYVTGIIAKWMELTKGPKSLPCDLGSVSETLGIIKAQFPIEYAKYEGTTYSCLDNLLK